MNSKVITNNDMFEPLVAGIDVPIDRSLVNGSGVFCYWIGPYSSVHCRLRFHQPVGDALYQARYHHKLSSALNSESERRKVAGTCHFGGGIVKISEGEVSVLWLPDEQAAEAMDDDFYSSTIADLKSRYFQILSGFDLAEIYSSPELSGIFLPMPSRAYISSRRKVIIIGQETKGWRDSTCSAKLHATTSLEEVEKSMEATLAYNKKKPGKIKFRQFYKKASSELCTESHDSANAALWSNQFCMSYKKGSPVNSPQFQEIKAMSYELLRAQFEILEPDVAIFAVGSNRDAFIKECFDYKTVKVLEKDRLWHFKIGNTHCFRTNHPRWGGSAPFLEQAIALAKSNA